MQDTPGGAKTNSLATFSYGALHTQAQVKENQLELIYNSSVRTQDTAWKNMRKQWMIETDGGKEIYGNPCEHHDVMLYIYIYIYICVYEYMNTYTYVCGYIYIYIYIYPWVMNISIEELPVTHTRKCKALLMNLALR